MQKKKVLFYGQHLTDGTADLMQSSEEVVHVLFVYINICSLCMCDCDCQ